MITRVLKLDQDQYVALIGEAEKLLANPNFTRLMNLIARALADAPVLDAEAVHILARAVDVPVPEPQGAAP